MNAQNADLDEVLACTLRLPKDAITDDLSFGSISSWDSLTHIGLMELLESRYGIKISDDDMLELTSVQAIRDFLHKILPR
jgi:acyl carrier protein